MYGSEKGKEVYSSGNSLALPDPREKRNLKLEVSATDCNHSKIWDILCSTISKTYPGLAL